MASEILRPDGNTYYIYLSTNAASNYLAVNEVTPDDMTVNFKVGSSNGDIYTLSAHSIPEDATIDNVVITLRCAATVAGNSVKPILIITGGVIVGSSVEIPYSPVVYSNNNFTYTTNPDTASAWTRDDITNLQVGPFLDTNGGVCWCSQVYVTVNYTLPVPDFTPKIIVM